MLGFPMTINVDQEILNQIVEAAAKYLERHGVMKLVIVNGHGGNDFKAFLRTLYGRSKVFCSLVNWYRMMADASKTLFANPGEHADEMETSLVQALRPELVDLNAADEGKPRLSRFEAARKGWVWYPRPFERLTSNSGCGDPRQANPEKGERLLSIAAQRLGEYFCALAKSPMDENFPFE
jgi:creatinine amidohydrolase